MRRGIPITIFLCLAAACASVPQSACAITARTACSSMARAIFTTPANVLALPLH